MDTPVFLSQSTPDKVSYWDSLISLLKIPQTFGIFDWPAARTVARDAARGRLGV